MMLDVLDRVVVRKFADAQERADAIFDEDAIAAFGVDMHIAEVDVAGVIETNSCGKRRARTGDAIAVIVGDGDVLRPIEFKGKGFGALAGLFFGLRRVYVPVLGVIELDLVADVVFGGELVDVAGRCGVGYDEACLGEGVGGPNVGDGSAASVAHPEAGILRVPALAQVGVGGVIVVVGIGPAAVTAEKAHIINEGVLT